jgi:hypothetical protein
MKIHAAVVGITHYLGLIKVVGCGAPNMKKPHANLNATN